MRNPFLTRLGLALALVTVVASTAAAGPKTRPAIAKSHLDGEFFSVSGTCIGALAGDFQLDGVTYRLAPEARIFEVGRGFVPQGTTFNYRIINLSGTKVRNPLLVQTVLVRPADTAARNFGRPAIRLRDESSPR